MRPAGTSTATRGSAGRTDARGRGYSIATLLALAILPTLAWALWPARDPDIPRVRHGEAPARPAVTTTSFDADAFSTPLWVAPPSPPPPPAPPEPQRAPPQPPTPEPLKVQLLSIVREGGTHRAMLFDPDTKKLLTLAVGDHVGALADGRTITSIADKDVVITGTSPHTSQTLSLRDPGSSPPSTIRPRRRP